MRPLFNVKTCEKVNKIAMNCVGVDEKAFMRLEVSTIPLFLQCFHY